MSGNKGFISVIDKQISNIHWPGNSQFGLCLTHDVDRVQKSYQFVTNSVRQKSPRYLLNYFSEPDDSYWKFRDIVNLENKYDVRSTFFFLNETKKLKSLNPRELAKTLGRYSIQDPEIIKVIKYLSRNNWEIGLHGSFESYNKKDLMSSEKKALEQITGSNIIGIRQHWLNLNIPKTWKIQKSLKLKYDCSYMDNKQMGFKSNIFYPFRPFNDSFVVFPTVIMDTYLFQLFKKPREALKACLQLMDICEKKNTFLTILWHQRVFNKHDFPYHKVIYEYLINEALRRNAWVGPLSEAYDIVEKSKF